MSTAAVSGVTSTTATCGGEVTATGGADVTARGVCWGTSQNPTVADAHTSDGSGTGTFTSNITGLTANTTYYVRAYATNSVGTAYGAEVSFTTEASDAPADGDGDPCPGAATVTDYDGNTYNTVKIGNQCWMRENLRTTHYADGTAVPAGGDNGSDTEPYYCVNTGLDAVTYGYLYNWPAAMHNTSSSSANPSGVQGVCPTGWHLPSDAEWSQLTDYVGSVPEYQCGGSSGNITKALASTEGWNGSSGECYPGDQSVTVNNATGFSGVPAGLCYGSSFSYYAGVNAYFWSSTEDDSGRAWYRNLYYYGAYVLRGHNPKGCGFSVRCLRD